MVVSWGLRIRRETGSADRPVFIFQAHDVCKACEDIVATVAVNIRCHGARVFVRGGADAVRWAKRLNPNQLVSFIVPPSPADAVQNIAMVTSDIVWTTEVPVDPRY
jgi:hypothetical protein